MALVLATNEIFTPLMESAAAAIAAGFVIGTFLGATRGAFLGWPRREVEKYALRDGHSGATVVLLCWIVDKCNVYTA